ncbi:hypothetical protein ACFCYX_38355 [Streptomyces populi]|uniref:hypothetical protein n=1 Tax=Streptomyces populi TaxID=2058924 RepID=UPI0035D84468
MLTWTKVVETVCAGGRRDKDEHWRTHQGVGGEHVHDEQNGDNQALTELRRRLHDGLALSGLNKTQLAARTSLGRTTVSQAFQADGPVPSAQTVAVLARALKLPVEELLVLQRETAGNGERPGPGRLIGEWGPHDLEVHPAGRREVVDGSDVPGTWVLPGYVRREHDRVLGEAVQDAAAGRSRIVILVGTSSTGKTRACWEAVQPLADEGWRLWHPFDPTRAEAALEDLHCVQPRTVVWLNEAQHYLGNRAAGERIASAVHHLLISPERGPVLVLATLWPEYAQQYTALPAPDEDDPYSRARELLCGRTVTIPDSFDAAALAAAAALAKGGDRLLADALTRAHTDGRMTQDLAGAPELLARYQSASPPARALLEAAMDARRLGVGLHLPQAFLTDAATDYLSQYDYDQLTDNWAETAFAELAEPVHGKQAPLRCTTPRPPRRPPTPSTATHPPSRQQAGPVFRLADYLEQHGRTSRTHLCPPASFWHSAHAHLTHPDDLDNLTQAAEERHRLQWAHHLQRRAADHGSERALFHLAWLRREAGDRQGEEALVRQAAGHGSTDALVHLAELREEAGDRRGAEALARQAADQGSTDALVRLAGWREMAGDGQSAEALYRQAADYGSTHALVYLGELREKTGDAQGAEALYRQAADQGDTDTLCFLAERRERFGDRQGAEALARQAADRGKTDALFSLAERREDAGDRQGAEALARQAADRGKSDALFRLAERRERAGDRHGAEALYRQAADHGVIFALVRLGMLQVDAGDRQPADCGGTRPLFRLAEELEGAGDRQGAEALARQAADRGDTDALFRLARLREEAGDRQGAEFLRREVVDHYHISSLFRLAEGLEGVGDRQGAEFLYRQAADRGDTDALFRLAERRERAGDRQGAETLARQAADHDYSGTVAFLPEAKVLHRLWPYGLDPDGAPTPRWQ